MTTVDKSIPQTPVGSPALAARALTAGHARRAVISDLDLGFVSGTITALVGPNGSGKSTLLMTLARVLARQGGHVLLHGQTMHDQSSIEVARQLAVLPQTSAVPAGLTVRELVEQGRYPQRGPWSMLVPRDDAPTRRALELTGLTSLRDRRVDSLSGGERQRAWIAMTLAQETSLLLLDEPTTYLDIGHQVDLMRLIERLRSEQGLTVVMVLHDLNQAARYADRIIAIHDGSIHADGPPDQVITPALLQEVFGIDADVVAAPHTGRPVFIPR